MFSKNTITIQFTMPVPLQFCVCLNNAILYARSRPWPTCIRIRGAVYSYRQDCPSHSISPTPLTCGTHTSSLLQPPAPPLPLILSLLCPLLALSTRDLPPPGARGQRSSPAAREARGRRPRLVEPAAGGARS
jgi:hypothetical protein